MRTFIFFASLLLTQHGLLAQTSPARDTTTVRRTQQPSPNTDRRNGYEIYRSMDQAVSANPYSIVNTIDHRYEGLRGTPYFLPEWSKGRIEMTAGQTYTEVPLKFNAYQQQLVMRRPWAGNDSIIVDAQQVIRFWLNNADGQSYVFERLPTAKTDDADLRDSYFLVLYKGKTALLKRVAKVFKKADYKEPYSNNIRYDAFDDRLAYYLLKPDQTLVRVKLAKKPLLEAMNDRADALKTFVDEQKLTFKTEADAVTLVKQYDSL